MKTSPHFEHLTRDPLGLISLLSNLNLERHDPQVIFIGFHLKYKIKSEKKEPVRIYIGIFVIILKSYSYEHFVTVLYIVLHISRV